MSRKKAREAKQERKRELRLAQSTSGMVAKNAQTSSPIVAGEPHSEISIFERIKPVPLTPATEALLDLTASNQPIDPKLKKLLDKEDPDKIEYAVIEGVWQGIQRSRESLGLPASAKERK